MSFHFFFSHSVSASVSLASSSFTNLLLINASWFRSIERGVRERNIFKECVLILCMWNTNCLWIFMKFWKPSQERLIFFYYFSYGKIINIEFSTFKNINFGIFFPRLILNAFFSSSLGGINIVSDCKFCLFIVIWVKKITRVIKKWKLFQN